MKRYTFSTQINVSFFITFFLFSCRSVYIGHDVGKLVSFAYVDPLTKIFPETAYFGNQQAIADEARGEVASFQFAVRAALPIDDLTVAVTSLTDGTNQLDQIKTGFVEFVKVGRFAPAPARDRLASQSGYFPDPIVEKPFVNLPPNQTQPIWISVNIPKDASPGKYLGQVIIKGKLDGKSFSASKSIQVQVYQPVIDKTSLWVTNWYTLDRLSMLNDGNPVEQFSDRYWELTEILAKKMAEYRQNVALISPLRLAQFSKTGDQWQFDFTHFNKMVRLFIDAGVIGRIEGGHIGGRLGNWDSDFGIFIPIVTDTGYTLQNKPLNDPGVKEFYQQFFQALFDDLHQHNWADIYMQHIADEPTDTNFQSYIDIATSVKSIIPDIKIIEACHTHNLQNVVDVWVPQLNFLDEGYDFYKERQEQGDEVWFYTCLAPQGNYANRFIELPLIKTRILHWINFRYHIPGYLHWGLDFWRSDPFGETTGIITESGNILPGGDAWIVYPAKNKLNSSIRLEAMRDGIEDYELLKMLEIKDPDMASELARQVVYGFDHYDTNIDDFRAKRRKILQMLSQ